MKGRDIEFLYEIGSLRNIPRAWIQHLAADCASTLEHTLRVVFLALLIGRKEGVKDEEKLIKMALVHDLAAPRTSRTSTRSIRRRMTRSRRRISLQALPLPISRRSFRNTRSADRKRQR